MRRSLSRDHMVYEDHISQFKSFTVLQEKDHVVFKREYFIFHYGSQKVEQFQFAVCIIMNMITVFLFPWNFMGFYLYSRRIRKRKQQTISSGMLEL